MSKNFSKRRQPGHLFTTAADALKIAKLEEQQKIASAQMKSSAFQLAFADTDFLLRDDLRPVRLQLELSTPELVLKEHNIEHTVVIFGSARTPSPEMVEVAEKKLQIELMLAPQNPQLLRQQKDLKIQRHQASYYSQARLLARLVTERSYCEGCPKLHVITGGGPGIMEAANRGAADAGGESIGLNIVLPHEQSPNPYITPKFCFQFHYFAIRKMHFLLRARALVVFPGGFGTLDELFETLTLIQTGKVEPMPILIFGREFWGKVLNFDHLVEQGMINASDLKLFQFVDDAQEAWELIRASLQE